MPSGPKKRRAAKKKREKGEASVASNQGNAKGPQEEVISGKDDSCMTMHEGDEVLKSAGLVHDEAEPVEDASKEGNVDNKKAEEVLSSNEGSSKPKRDDDSAIPSAALVNQLTELVEEVSEELEANNEKNQDETELGLKTEVQREFHFPDELALPLESSMELEKKISKESAEWREMEFHKHLQSGNEEEMEEALRGNNSTPVFQNMLTVDKVEHVKKMLQEAIDILNTLQAD